MIESEAEVVLSRIQCSREDDYFSLRVEDKPSGRRVLEIQLTDTDFAKLMSSRVAYGSMRYYQSDSTLGKQVVIKPLEFEVVGASGYRPKEQAVLQVVDHTPAGWVADTYFGSQSSFFRKDGKTFARTTIRKWVDEKPEGRE